MGPRDLNTFLWSWEEKVELEKIRYDYIRWMFDLDFCIPRYLIFRKLGMIKLKVGWARRYKERISVGRAGNIARECMTEKKTI